MKKKFFLIMLILFITGCSKEPKQLSYDKIEGLPLNEQVDSIIKNTDLIEQYEIVIDESSVAIVYPAEYISDSRLTLDNSKESFPNVAMTFVEHLEILNLDEIVITSYEPSDTEMTGLTKVSAFFTKETIDGLDFEKWKEEKKDYPHRFYRYSDGYLIRGTVWDKLDEETQEVIGNASKNAVNSDSQFWEYYGDYVE